MSLTLSYVKPESIYKWLYFYITLIQHPLQCFCCYLTHSHSHINDGNHTFGMQCFSRTSTCGLPEIEPPTLRLVNNLFYILNHSCHNCQGKHETKSHKYWTVLKFWCTVLSLRIVYNNLLTKILLLLSNKTLYLHTVCMVDSLLSESPFITLIIYYISLYSYLLQTFLLCQ